MYSFFDNVFMIQIQIVNDESQSWKEYYNNRVSQIIKVQQYCVCVLLPRDLF